MTKIDVILIDDEPLAREVVKNYLADRPDVRVVAECSNGFEAMKAIAEFKPHLIFLDIQMPKIDGFELLEILEEKPEIIFCTAYDQFAIRAFEHNAIDYLLKPFARDRFLQAVDKAMTKISQPSPAPRQDLGKLQETLDTADKVLDRVVSKLGSKVTVIPVEKIWYIEAQDDYVMIYSELGNHLKEKTMKYFEEHLPREIFVRIHRSSIINISQIASIELYSKDTHLVTLRSGAKLKASAEGYKRLRELFK